MQTVETRRRAAHPARALAWLRRDAGVVVIVGLFLLMLVGANPRIYATDEVQYYAYLRSVWFDGDLNFQNEYQTFHERNPSSGIAGSLLQPNRIRPTGLYGNVAPVGSALMWSPFFLLADLLVRIARAFGSSIPADGYSWPYIRAVCYASALYGLGGLLLSYRLARQYVGMFAATLATLAIWFASPLLFYMMVQMPMSHATGFFLVALFISIWHATRPERPWWGWLALGLTGALMTMAREQLGLFLLIPAIEGLVQYGRVFSRGTAALRAAGRLVAGHALFLATFVVGLLPQLIAYTILNGSPRPSGEVGGKLVWCSPHFIDTLIDYNPAPSAFCPIANDISATFPPFAHGAFIWNPLLAVALVGLVLLWRRDRLLTSVLTVAFLAQTYINGAFGTTWHLTGAFGFRRLIEATPLFVLGLALLAQWLLHRRWKRGVLAAIALLFVGWNLALMLNWAVFNDKTALRKGMQWPELVQWQLEVPGEVLGKANALLFNRCELVDNGCR